MTDAGHSPLPWQLESNRIDDADGRLVVLHEVAATVNGNRKPVEQRLADAELIVRAVNGLADLTALLRYEVRGSDATGYGVAGLWCGSEPFRTRAEAEAKLLEYVRRNYTPKAEGRG